MTRGTSGAVALLASVLLAACTGHGSGTGAASPSVDPSNPYFNRAEFERQLAQRQAAPQGDPSAPWLQAIDPSYVDTARYARPGRWRICFSHAGTRTPREATGLNTMRAEAKLHDQIGSFNVLDAHGDDTQQVADIEKLLAQGCDALIVAPGSTGPLTTAVLSACEQKVPVVVFERRVDTACPVTYVHPVGGYAFGASAAEFLTQHMTRGGKVLVLRTQPDVDVYESRWAAAKVIFDSAGAEVVGTEFTGGDRSRMKGIVADYVQRVGRIDGVWMDAGTTAAATVTAFEDAGAPVPPINGEDQQDFLELWQSRHLTAIAPTDPVYSWRTALIAATDILAGNRVPREWVLPQPVITADNLARYLRSGMPPLFYPTCGCQQMPNFPTAWGGR